MSTFELLILAVVIVAAAVIVIIGIQRNRGAAQLKADEEAAIDENLADARKAKSTRRSKSA